MSAVSGRLMNYQVQAAPPLTPPLPPQFGEFNFSGIPLRDWTWTCNFSLPADFPTAHARYQLFFESLDTVADITLNGVSVGAAANAHRPHAFDVTGGLVKEGLNQLQIKLRSAVHYAGLQASNYPYAQVGALPHYNFIRKAASDFGWDWGPAFAPVGITGGVWLRAYADAFLTGLSVQQEHLANGSIVLSIGAFLQPGPSPSSGTLTASIGPASRATASSAAAAGGGGGGDDDGGSDREHWGTQQEVTIPACSPGDCPTPNPPSLGADLIVDPSCSQGAPASQTTGWSSRPSSDTGAGRGEAGGALGSCGSAGGLGAVRRSVTVLVTPPFQLWWPHEFGAQAMYLLTVTYTPGNASEGEVQGAGNAMAEGQGGDNATGQGEGDTLVGRASSLERRIGFRQVELVKDPITLADGSPGETFYFRVNGLPLYAKGANIVPADILETRVTPAALRDLVHSAKAAHMNMLRVWGGGRYFQDAFYEACDEAGVLVWQEAMFACSMYPRDQAFLQEVTWGLMKFPLEPPE
ncbi:hypothetical protein N2152v2_002691 [Parachlorella kessleri]